jgi:hypothetical protein
MDSVSNSIAGVIARLVEIDYSLGPQPSPSISACASEYPVGVNARRSDDAGPEGEGAE